MGTELQQECHPYACFEQFIKLKQIFSKLNKHIINMFTILEKLDKY